MSTTAFSCSSSEQVLEQARHHDPVLLGLLRTVPGIGKILALVMIYEIHDIRRFPRVGDFISYCRLVKPARESAGKNQGSKNSKIGNVHLKWAFSEAHLFHSSRVTPRPKSFISGWSASTAKPKPSRSSPRSSAAPSTASSSTGSPLIRKKCFLS